MFIHDILLLKSATRPDLKGSGRFNLTFDRPMIMTCYPLTAGTFMDSKGDTADTLAGSIPFLNFVLRKRADSIDSRSIQECEGLINQFVSQGKFNADQKRGILDSFINSMGNNLKVHLEQWTNGTPSGINDYSLGYTDNQIRESMSKLINASDRRKVSFRSSERLKLSSWFSQIESAPQDEVFRLNIEPGDIITGVIKDGDISQELQEMSTDSSTDTVTALPDISEIQIHRKQFGDEGKKLSDMLAVVFSPAPELMKFSEEDGLITENLTRVEICEPGIYKKGTPFEFEITDEHIDSLIENFNESKNQIKPPLRKWRPSVKLGHNPTITPGNDGLPSFGWVEQIYREGNKAVADLIKVPVKLAKLVKAGAFRRVSPELKVSKTEPRMMLTALSLLGADIPEIKTLDDICDLYSPAGADTIGVTCSETEPDWQYVSGAGLSADIDDPVKIMFADTIIRHMSTSDSEQGSPVDDESAKGVIEMNEELFKLLKAKFSKNNTEVSSMEFSDENLARLQMMDAEAISENERLKNELAEFKAAEAAKRAAETQQTIEQKCSELVESKKLPPAMKDTAMKLASAMADKEMTLEFSEDGKTSEHKGYDAFFEFMNKALPVHVAFSEGAGVGMVYTPDQDPGMANPAMSDYERGVADAKALRENMEKSRRPLA